ncbi:MAG TPA: hypothetical protein VHE34_12510 [Puia sp.]|uniref:hypothetical protein n=1 Tax=Puia sp. TaxID=2045100 RepID=UPI002CAC0D54|nr:hypothetical protein [Puia sp.]HVU96045.1 hypothetical protein [Puia sp.]
MRRRNFILLTIGGVGASIAPACKPHTNPALSRPLFLSTICDPATLRHIGNNYRKTTPAETKEDRLVSLLTTDLPQGSDPTNQLDAKARQDYAAGKTVTIDGWVLSITEARQCALYSLQKP